MFFTLVTTFGCEKFGTQKIKKQFFFQDKFYSLKAHAHYFTVFIYLPTYRAAKLGIFIHFMSTNLSRCSQSMNSLRVLVHSRDHNSLYYHCPKNFSVLLPDRVCYLMTYLVFAICYFQLHKKCW